MKNIFTTKKKTIKETDIFGELDINPKNSTSGIPYGRTVLATSSQSLLKYMPSEAVYSGPAEPGEVGRAGRGGLVRGRTFHFFERGLDRVSSARVQVDDCNENGGKW